MTLNYRLGVFGFLAHPELSREASYNGSGNYDIRVARADHEQCLCFQTRGPQPGAGALQSSQRSSVMLSVSADGLLQFILGFTRSFVTALTFRSREWKFAAFCSG